MVSIRSCLRPTFLALVFSVLGTGLLSAAELSPAQADQLLQRLAQRPEASGVSLRFQEERRLPLLTDPVRETGTLQFLPPDKFRRDVPGSSLTISDGQTLWLYYPELRQAEKYPLARNRLLSDSLRSITAALNLQNEAKQFSSRVTEEGSSYRIDLTPLRGAMRKAVKTISVWFSSDLKLQRIQILGTQGEDTRIQFSDERPLKSGEGNFTFDPPQGVNVTEPLGR